MTLVEETATGEEIHAVMKNLEMALKGVPRGHAVIACLAMVLSIMNPNLTEQQMKDGVYGASEWLATFLSYLDEGGKKATVN